MSKWNSPERDAPYRGGACPICRRGHPLGIVVELNVTNVISSDESPMRGCCCRALKRPAVESHTISVRTKGLCS